jgi:hypothetical protein
MDETYTKVMGTCKYLYCAVDYQGNTVRSNCFGVCRWVLAYGFVVVTGARREIITQHFVTLHGRALAAQVVDYKLVVQAVPDQSLTTPAPAAATPG